MAAAHGGKRGERRAGGARMRGAGPGPLPAEGPHPGGAGPRRGEAAKRRRAVSAESRRAVSVRWAPSASASAGAAGSVRARGGPRGVGRDGAAPRGAAWCRRRRSVRRTSRRALVDVLRLESCCCRRFLSDAKEGLRSGIGEGFFAAGRRAWDRPPGAAVAALRCASRRGVGTRISDGGLSWGVCVGPGVGLDGKRGAAGKEEGSS